MVFLSDFVLFFLNLPTTHNELSHNLFLNYSPLERSGAQRRGVSVFLVLLREAQILSSAQQIRLFLKAQIKGLMFFEFPNNLQPTTHNGF
jgi:hypothetical protein